MNKFDQYIKWKTQETETVYELRPRLHELKTELESPNYFLNEGTNLLTLKETPYTTEYVALKEHLRNYYRQMPESSYLRKRALPNLARELVLVLSFIHYPELNQAHVYKIMDMKMKSPSLRFLLDKMGDIITEAFESSYYVKVIGLNKHRINMAQFWRFGNNYEIIDDNKAISMSDSRTISVIDLRDGSITDLKRKEQVETLLDLKDNFVFGIAK